MMRIKLKYFKITLLFAALLNIATVSSAQTIVSFNTRGNQGSLAEKIEFIVDFSRNKNIHNSSITMIALQEIDSVDWLKNVLEVLGPNWKLINTKEKILRENFAILYDGYVWQNIEQDYTSNVSKFSFRRDPFVAKFTYRRMITYQFINVHLPFQDEERRTRVEPIQNELIKVLDLKKDIKQFAQHTIALGDFNLVVKQIDQTAQVKDSGFMPWWQSDDKKDHTSLDRKGGYLRRLDHFFFTPEIKNRVVVSRIEGPDFYRGDFEKYLKNISDHVPIMMNISPDEIQRKKSSAINYIRGLLVR